MALYELNKVARYYLVNKKKKYVLKDISISLPVHGFVTILGKSGSGKSTLLNMLGKIDTPSEGKIYFNNEDLSKYAREIEEPTLLIWGKNDTAVKIDYAYELNDLLKNSNLIVYENATHYAYLEKLDNVYNDINNFLKE